MIYRALLAEDEPPARARLRRLLEAHRDAVEIVGEADDVEEARRAILSEVPDLLFLDVQLRGGTGFDLLRSLDEPPLVIFTTVFDRYALEAFETTSIDYLLKPIEPPALARAIGKLRRLARPGGRDVLARELRQLLDGLRPSLEKPSPMRRLGIRRGDRTLILPVEEVGYFGAEDKVVVAHGRDGQRYLIDFSLTELEDRLDPEQFVRIHRATIVNIEHVREIERWFGGRLRVVLADGTAVLASKKMAGNLKAMISF